MKKNILLGVTGCISAYKSIELVRLLIKDGFDVKVILTENAKHFVTPLTFQTLSKNKVYTEMFASVSEWIPEHISLSDWADLIAVVPASANSISKISLGLADDLLSASILAFDGPIVVALSMNERMYNNEIFKKNLQNLEQYERFKIINPEQGELACGTSGKGRLAELNLIFDTIRKSVNSK